MPLAATASVSPVCCVVCLSFWPVFRSLPVCWSAFILAFFLILLVNLFWSLISFLSSHLSTSHSYLTFVILFSPPTFSFSFSAPFLSFSFFSPPTYNSHFFPHHPCLLPPLCGTWCWGVAEVQWTALPSAVELSPGPSGAQCVYVLQEMFFFKPAAPVKNMYRCFWFRHPCTYCTHFSEPVLVKNSIKRAEGGWCGFTVTYWF